MNFNFVTLKIRIYIRSNNNNNKNDNNNNPHSILSSSSGRCVNTDGSFRCECPVGYRLDPSGKVCVDSNECAEEAGICGNGTCNNVVGTFECDCAPGFAPGADGRCADVDECYEPEGAKCAFRCLNT